MVFVLSFFVSILVLKKIFLILQGYLQKKSITNQIFMRKFTTLFLLLFTAFNMLAANITLYYVNSTGWSKVNAYAWKNSTQAAIADWPGTAATKETKTMNGYDVYSYTFDSSKADRIIFNNGSGGTGNQTDDLTVNTSKPYYYNGGWNATITYDTSVSTTTYCIAGTGVSGTNWCCGQEWSPSGCELTDGSISFSALPAGEYKFKITNGTWNSSWGYSSLTSTTGLTNDTDGNVVITLSETSDVKIVFNTSTKKITVTITEVSTPVDPEPDPEPEAPTATIAAIRNRLSINTNDFTDFAGLYVSKLPTIEGGKVSAYEWQFSSNNTSWAKYSDGDGATWDNIRPNKAGYYRCTLTYDVNGETQTVNSNTLQITNKGGSAVTFTSNLPVVLVRTSKDFPTPPSGYPTTEQVAELKAKRSVDVKILWNKDGGNVSNTDINNSSMLHYDRKARMNYRGSSSLNNAKKSYAFVAGDKNCDSKKLGEVKTKKFAMFDGDAHKDWVMYASYPDATFMRNILSYHQYAKMTGLWGVKCRYVEMYLDGEYQGIYVFMDKMTQDETRINVNEDTGYIVRFDKTDIVDRFDGTAGKNADSKRCTFITSNTGKKTISTYNMQVDQAFEIEYPEREDISTFDDDDNIVDDSAWEAKVNEVKGMFVAMENAILANDYDKLAQIIDYESWADWFIINEFTRNADAYRISCVFSINSATDKIVANPIWDYELGWANQDTKTSGLMVEDNTYYNDDFPTPFWWTGKGKSNCNGILGDCKFKTIVKERWEKHIGTNGALNSTVLNAKIDSLANVLSQGAGTREKNKWSTYSSSSTSTLKSWITNRTSGLKSVINGWETCSGETTPTTYYIAGALIENGTAVSGGDWCCGKVWDPAGCALTNNTVTYTGLAAGDYKFKVTDGTWSKNWGYAALSSTTGLTNDTDGNVVVTLSKAADVTITFNPGTEKISVTIKESSVVEPEVDFTIAAIRDRLSINTNDFTDFAGLYVAKLPTVEGGTLSSYAWQYSTDKNTWAKYSDGQGASWDNIRPNKAGYYRSVMTYDVNGEAVEKVSNILQIKSNGGSTVSFSSKLPVFLVRTAKDFPVHTGTGYPDNDGVAALKAKRSVDVKVLWNQDGGSVKNTDVNNSDILYYDRKARMNYRGSSSLYNDKKSYAFVTGDKNCDSKKPGEVKTKKLAMFGDDAHKDWVLYASAPDATYMRNVLSYHQYAKMTGLWGVKCRHVELYVDGEYKGIYVFMDKMTADENRINVGEDGYIVRFDKTDIVDRYEGYAGKNADYKRCTFTTSNTGKTNISTYNQVVDQAFEIEYPEREDISSFDDDDNVTDDSAWEAKVSAVKAKFTEMEKAILANDYDKLATIIDYETWAEWFIINEFTKNADAYRISCVFTLNSIDDKIVANPIWDYELGLGNQNTNTSGLMVEESQYYSDAFPTPFWWTGKGKSNCNGILGDCKFRAIVKERWAKHIAADGALNSTVLSNKMDSIKSVLSTSSKSTSVSTSSLKSWVTNRTTGLNTVISAWEVCPVPVVKDLKIGEFATIYVGETANATATYTVENASDVEVVLSGSDAFSIVSKSSGKVEIKFAPTAAGTFSGKLTITVDGVASESIEFSASAVLKPVVKELQAPVFEEIFVGEVASVTATYVLENALSASAVLDGDDAFAIRSQANGVVEIVFMPEVAGTFTTTLTVTSGVASQSITLSASAVLKPVVKELQAPVFEEIFVGEVASVTATYVLENATTASAVLDGDDAFAIKSQENGAVVIEFAPSAAGTFTTTLTVTSGVASQSITLSASAVLKPVIKELQAPAFEEIFVGEVASVTATYILENALSASAVLDGDDAFAIKSQENGAVVIEFAPSAAGTFTTTLTVTSGVASQSITLSASAVLKPVVKELQAPAFEEIFVGEVASVTATYVLENATTASAVLDGDDAFAIRSQANGVVEIVFMPDAAGTFTTTLTVTSGVASQSITLSASAVLKPVVKELQAPVFEEIFVGEVASVTATYILENALRASAVLDGDDAFAIKSQANGVVEIVFMPETAGTFTTTLTVTSGVASQSITLSASAVLKPVIKELQAPAFEEIFVGEVASVTATYVLENATTASAVLDGDDAFAIKSQENGAVVIEFAPSAAGTFTTTLTVTSGVASQSITLSASAVLKPVIKELQAPAFEEIFVGEVASATASYTVENASDIIVELTGDPVFNIVNQSEGSIQVVFVPTEAGTFNGKLTIIADGIVSESMTFSASAVLKPVISILSAPVFDEIKVGGYATAVATYSIENATTSATVEIAGDEAFFIKKQTASEVQIVFMPDAAGVYTATLTIKVGEISESVEFTAVAIEDITTSVEENVALNIYAKDGTIYCDEEFTIYNLAGVDVTNLNGSLQGVYVVATTNGNKQVSVW